MKAERTSLIVCPDCEGTGKDYLEKTVACPLCDGKGKVSPTKLKGLDFSYKEQDWAKKMHKGEL